MSTGDPVICYCFWGVSNASGYSPAESVITWCLGSEQIAHVSVVFGTLVRRAGLAPSLVLEPWELSAWIDRKSGLVPIADKTDPQYTPNPKFEVFLVDVLFMPVDRSVALQLQEPLLEASQYQASDASGGVKFNGHEYPGLGLMAADMLARPFRAWSSLAGRDVRDHLLVEQEKLKTGGKVQCAQLCVMHLLWVIHLHRAMHSSKVIAYDAAHVSELRRALNARTSLTPRAVFDLFAQMSNACTQCQLFVKVSGEVASGQLSVALSSGRQVQDFRSLVIPYPGVQQTHLPHRFIS